MRARIPLGRARQRSRAPIAAKEIVRIASDAFPDQFRPTNWIGCWNSRAAEAAATTTTDVVIIQPGYNLSAREGSAVASSLRTHTLNQLNYLLQGA
jgi:hypothetical protein